MNIKLFYLSLLINLVKEYNLYLQFIPINKTICKLLKQLIKAGCKNEK